VLRYGLSSEASGAVYATAEGRKIQFSATVSATLAGQGEIDGTYEYSIPFTTETTSAPNRAGTKTLSVFGMRLVEGAWYGQIVGATTNKGAAFPKPGAAVYTVLSGSFDQVP
jgi:hypothetical protein